MDRTKLLAENKTERKLKSYLSRVAHRCGDDYAAAILVDHENVKQAICYYSSEFDKEKESDIIYALLKGSVISDDRENLNNHLVSALIEDNEIPLLVESFRTNLQFREAVAKTFIENSTRSNEDILQANREKTFSLDNLESLCDYKRKVERQKKFTLHK